MKTVLTILFVIVLLAGLAGVVYYLVTQVDYSGITDTFNSVGDWFSDKFSALTDLFD